MIPLDRSQPRQKKILFAQSEGSKGNSPPGSRHLMSDAHCFPLYAMVCIIPSTRLLRLDGLVH